MRYDIYSLDFEWVHWVRASLLGLYPGTKPSEADFKSSAQFVPWSVASKKESPEVVTSHWLPVLQTQGRLADCLLDQFNTTEDLVPLYTPEKLEQHLPAALEVNGPIT